MHAAFLAFLGAGRTEHPELRVVFAMLAGLAPLHGERLAARGGPDRHSRPSEPDPLVFYDTSSYGPLAIGALADAIGGPGQLLYGSDRPVVEPALLHEPDVLDWELLADATARAFGAPAFGGVSHAHGRVSRPQVQAPEAAIAAAQSPPNVPVARGGGSPMRTPLASVPRPRDRDLTAPELQEFVADLAAQPELWIERVHHDHTQRVYEELLSDGI